MNIKSIIAIILIAFFFTGCATKMSLIDYNQTNPVKIEESVKGLNIQDFIKGKVEKDESIILKSIEQPMLFQGVSNGVSYSHTTSSLDWGTKYLIEDNLITALNNNGYKVLERDPEIMESLFSESGDRYALLNLEEIYGFGKDNKENDDGQKGIKISREALIELIDSEKDKAETSRKYQLLTDLLSADKLLSYRVLECGIIYKEIDMDLTNIKRLARTRLHCRLEDAKTGEILLAGTIENEIEDTIPKSKVSEYEEIHYRFYDHTLPNMSQETQGEMPLLSKDTVGVNPQSILTWIGGFFLLFLLIVL